MQDWAPWQRETSKFNHVTIPDYYLELGAKSQCSAVDEQSLGKPKCLEFFELSTREKVCFIKKGCRDLQWGPTEYQPVHL